ncbi:MAG: LytR C-terminal domain-containing protein [Candidatus Ancillula sp.]|jgi:hypothetical protein|nr:LytR C-terminal domain-containing protein [Candidatus Ancillula sp.]
MNNLGEYGYEDYAKNVQPRIFWQNFNEQQINLEPLNDSSTTEFSAYTNTASSNTLSYAKVADQAFSSGIVQNPYDDVYLQDPPSPTEQMREERRIRIEPSTLLEPLSFTPALPVNIPEYNLPSAQSAEVENYYVDFSVPQHAAGRIGIRRLRRAFIFLVVFALAVCAGTVFYFARTGTGPEFAKDIAHGIGIKYNSTPQPQPSNSTSLQSSSSDTTSGIDKTIGIRVSNGSGILNLSDSNVKKLKEAGFPNAVANNAGGELPQQNVVYYKSSAITAKKIAEILGIKVVVQNAQIDSPVEIVLVSDLK